MKVLLTAYVRFPNALAWHALEVCRGLHRAGHEVYLFCQRNSPLAEWSTGAPFRVNRELNLNRVDPQNVLRGFAGLRRALETFQPDILNPHCPPGHMYLALARRLTRSGAAMVRTVAEPRPPKRNWINRHLHEQAADAVVLTTESSRRRYSEVFDFDHAKVATILPGFRADDFCADMTHRDYRRQLGLSTGQMLAGVIARMSPEKGQEVLLEALRLLPDTIRKRMHCVIAGKDSRERTRQDLSAMARNLGVEQNVTFLGPLDDVRPLISELDLGIITSTRSEAICRIALEYMSYGVPIVASSVNILPEVVRDGANGWTFPNHDARALAGRLQEIVEFRDERVQRGRIGHKLVRSDLSLENEIEQLLSVFETASRKAVRA